MVETKNKKRKEKTKKEKENEQLRNHRNKQENRRLQIKKEKANRKIEIISILTILTYKMTNVILVLWVIGEEVKRQNINAKTILAIYGITGIFLAIYDSINKIEEIAIERIKEEGEKDDNSNRH